MKIKFRYFWVELISTNLWVKPKSYRRAVVMHSVIYMYFNVFNVKLIYSSREREISSSK